MAFLTDTHVNQDPLASSVDLQRLSAIVARTNSLSPDLVLLGGDYIATAHRKGDVSLRTALKPFSNLKSRYGTYGVIGNHDCMEPENTAATMTSDFLKAGIRPLINRSAEVGPIQVVGLDDLWCGDSDIGAIARGDQEAEGRPVVVVSHNPDVFPQMPKTVALTLAGHTHGAQIVPPVIGPIVSVSRFGQLYRYGRIVQDGKQMIVSSGLGGLPLRWNAHPEIVLVTLRPQPADKNRP